MTALCTICLGMYATGILLSLGTVVDLLVIGCILVYSADCRMGPGVDLHKAMKMLG